jgi:hypothetical protein
MSTSLNLKEIERKAFRSTYQDGLWDMYFGLIVVGMAIFIHRPAGGYGPLNILLMVLAFSLAYGLFRAGKKYITLPRMGQVRFGAVRKRKKSTLALIMGAFVLLQVGLVGLTTLGWLNPVMSARLNSFLNEHGGSLPVVAALASLMVGTSMLVIAYFSDFPRGYAIAILMALAVFLMIYLNQPVWPIMIGVLIILPGLVLFVRFLKAYPLQPEATPNE